MTTIKDFMEAVDYKITEGSQYLWKCFGDDAFQISSWNGKYEDGGHSFGLIFDTKTQTVYEIEAHDYKAELSYRWTNPDFVESKKNEAKSRTVDNAVAYDHVEFTELELAEDILEKISCINLGLPYDTRIKIPIELSDEELLTFMKLAHERDITFNQLIEDALNHFIETNQLAHKVLD